MIIDNKGKLFGKVSIIDILIVLIVVGAIAGVGYKFGKAKIVNPLTGAKDGIQIQFYSAEVLDYAAKSVKIGDPVVDVLQNVTVGKVKEVKIGKSASPASGSTGDWAAAPKPGYASLLVTVDTEGKYGNSGVTIGNGVFYVGQSFERFTIGNAAFNFNSIKVYDIKKTR